MRLIAYLVRAWTRIRIFYRHRIAVTYILTRKNLLTLMNIITSMQITIPARKSTATNSSQYFETSQATIFRAINKHPKCGVTVSPIQPADLSPQRLYVLEGMLAPCWWFGYIEDFSHLAGEYLKVMLCLIVFSPLVMVQTSRWAHIIFWYLGPP